MLLYKHRIACFSKAQPLSLYVLERVPLLLSALCNLSHIILEQALQKMLRKEKMNKNIRLMQLLKQQCHDKVMNRKTTN